MVERLEYVGQSKLLPGSRGTVAFVAFPAAKVAGMTGLLCTMKLPHIFWKA